MNQKQDQVVAAGKVTGNILLFYAFDVGDEIDLELVRSKGMVNICTVPLSDYFKNYHIPLSFRMDDGPEEQDSQCISSKLHHFGVISFCYRVPFEDTFDDLKVKLIETKKVFDERAEIDAKETYKEIFSALRKPHFYNLMNDYFAVQVYPLKEKITGDEFKKEYGAKIASLLRLEVQNLSGYQTDEVLASSIGYYGEDLIVVDISGSFIYDDEYFEQLEFFDWVNIQKLEMQYFDRVLDERLGVVYEQGGAYKIPWKVYIPLIGPRMDMPVSQLAKLRVDISVITDRLESSIKMAEDAYYSRFYSMLVGKIALRSLRDSINRKLDIIHDLYSVYQDRLDTLHEEILTLVIIILIALEVLLIFVH